ncbi:MAG: FHA domain-containing protein [Phycisphaeraceae bacterium]
MPVQHGLTIGRDHTNSVCVLNGDVEPLHARILRKTGGGFEVVVATASAKLLLGEADGEVDRVSLANGVQFRAGSARFICRKAPAGDEGEDKPKNIATAIVEAMLQKPSGQPRTDPAAAAVIADLERRPMLLDITEWLELLHGHASCELRVRSKQHDTPQPRGMLRTHAGAEREAGGEPARKRLMWHEHAREIAKLEAEGARGIYVTLHELNPEHVQELDEAWRRNRRTAASEINFLAYRWLMIDLDPARPAQTPATADESRKAEALAQRIAADLSTAGWPAPVICSSGNGRYVLYRIDVMNDAAGKDLVRRCLHALAATYPKDEAGVTVDTTTHDVARIIRVMGTTNRKGEQASGRVWGRAYVISRPKDPPEPRSRPFRFPLAPDETCPVMVTGEQLQKLAADIPEKAVKATVGGALPTGDRQPPEPQPITEKIRVALDHVQRRFDALLQTRADCNEAIEGNGGRTATFAACCLAWRLAPTNLTAGEAATVVWELVRGYNRNRCVPVWDEQGPDSLKGQWVSAWQELHRVGQIGAMYKVEPTRTSVPAPLAQQPAVGVPGKLQENENGNKHANPDETSKAGKSAADNAKPSAKKPKAKGRPKPLSPPRYSEMPFGLLERMPDVAGRSVLCEIVELLGPSRTETTITYPDLARRVGASADTVTRRVKNFMADKTLAVERTGSGIRFQVLLQGSEPLARKAALENLRNGKKGFIPLLRVRLT